MDFEQKEKIEIDYVRAGNAVVGQMAFEGVIPNVERRYWESSSPYAKEEIETILANVVEIIKKNSDKSFSELTNLMIDDTLVEFRILHKFCMKYWMFI